MLSRLVSIAALCCLALCLGCSETDPVDACEGLRLVVQEQEKQIRSLHERLSEYENALESHTVVKGTFRIAALSYSDSIFVVTADMRGARLMGHFQEVGGTPLYATVFDDLNFTNWLAGGDSQALYNSGKLVVGDIDLFIDAPGTYHLVFVNTDSVITEKNVEAAVDLWFEA